MTASAGESSPALKASRPSTQAARTRVMFSTSTCSEVPSRRLASAAAWLEAGIFRLKTASADANQAGVAVMSNLVAAVHGDDAAAQVVVARLGESGRAQHAEQGFLIRMHADRLGQIPITHRVPRHDLAEQRQHVEGVGVIDRLEARR